MIRLIEGLKVQHFFGFTMATKRPHSLSKGTSGGAGSPWSHSSKYHVQAI
jgi:hypothetical protein